MQPAKLLIVCIAAASLVGCFRFPFSVSHDMHSFVSTEQVPLSIALIDQISREEVWRVDIPVGKKLVVDLNHDQDYLEAQSPAEPAKEIRWEIMEPGDFHTFLAHKRELSRRPVVLKMIVRDSPELPGDTLAGDYAIRESGDHGDPMVEAHEPIEGPATGDNGAGPAASVSQSELNLAKAQQAEREGNLSRAIDLYEMIINDRSATNAQRRAAVAGLERIENHVTAPDDSMGGAADPAHEEIDTMGEDLDIDQPEPVQAEPAIED